MASRDEPNWHPILAAVEGPVGMWRMIDTLGEEYGRIRLVRRGGEVGYRAECKGQLVGYYLTLRTSCRQVHMTFVRENSRSGREFVGGYPRRTSAGD
ncbi:hypothetical protein ACFVAJ_11180 [Agromyces sp. NPDC057679]|uniref:hypothetical protein n=1 Tax=Agromyces sp. NPDC057679 TaxID=3346207 RepID=UPI00366F5C2E